MTSFLFLKKKKWNRFGSQIVSVDAVAVVKGADIGSAKTTLEERMGVPHHLIDIVHPWERLNVVEWATMAKAVTIRKGERGSAL